MTRPIIVPDPLHKYSEYRKQEDAGKQKFWRVKETSDGGMVLYVGFVDVKEEEAVKEGWSTSPEDALRRYIDGKTALYAAWLWRLRSFAETLSVELKIHPGNKVLVSTVPVEDPLVASSTIDEDVVCDGTTEQE